jgi:quinol monooxygenase YgiN
VTAKDGSTVHVLLWEFRVRSGCEASFEAVYGPGGLWAQLFQRSPGYLGTELLRDASDPRRFLTVDRWVSASAHQHFRAEHESEYLALDAQCEPWTEAETSLGAWSAA